MLKFRRVRALFALIAAAGVCLGSGLAAPGPAGQTAEAQTLARSFAARIGGHAPGEAFLVDMRAGMDKKTHYVADLSFSADWINVSFRPANVSFTAHGMQLVATRLGEGGADYASGEFQRRGFYGYGRYEVVMRASGAPGAVSSFFTHTNEQFGDPHTEIDFEFLGRSPREVHLNYFVNGRDNPLVVPLWFDASKGAHHYAFEWAPDSIRWYIDGRLVRTITSATSPIGIPANSSRVIANLWTGSGSSREWVGAPGFDTTSATYLCMSYVTVGRKGRQCKDVPFASGS